MITEGQIAGLGAGELSCLFDSTPVLIFFPIVLKYITGKGVIFGGANWRAAFLLLLLLLLFVV